MPWIAVLQDWEPEDYLACARRYGDAGVDLARLPLVGLGSVCRRADARAIAAVQILAGEGYRLHGFGVCLAGLRAVGSLLASADSMAWSATATRGRDNIRLPECDRLGAHRGPCNNCLRWALRWRDKALAAVPVEPGPTSAAPAPPGLGWRDAQACGVAA